jgi:hypothetical protein
VRWVHFAVSTTSSVAQDVVINAAGVQANRGYFRYVKEQTGHSSIQITVDAHGHRVPGGNRAAVIV